MGPPPPGPHPPIPMLLPSVSWPLFPLKPVLHSLLAFHFCHLFKYILLFWFLILIGMLFLNLFCQIYENVLPAKAGSTFSQHDFYQRRVHDDVSVPKMASKLSLWGGSFHCVLLQKHWLLPTARKMAPLWKLCLTSPVSRMHFGWDFHVFALDFVIICETRFPFRCRA